jgi:hypothetical protein
VEEVGEAKMSEQGWFGMVAMPTEFAAKHFTEKEEGLVLHLEHKWMIRALLPLEEEQADAIVEGSYPHVEPDGHQDGPDCTTALCQMNLDPQGASCVFCGRRREDVVSENLQCLLTLVHITDPSDE